MWLPIFICNDLWLRNSMDSAMDLSLRTSAPSPSLQTVNPIIMSSSSPKLPASGPVVQIVRPVPRPPWSIVWYQNLWSASSSSADQIPRSESDCIGKSGGDNSSFKQTLRSNERSSFSVLNNLSTNTVNNCIDNNCNFSYVPSGEQPFQHRQFSFPTEEYYNSPSASEPLVPSSSSFYKPKQHTDTTVDLQQRQQNFTTSQKPCSRNDYSSDENNDSDNSENIVVTTTSSFHSAIGRSSIPKSSSSCSLDKPDMAVSFAGSNHLHHGHHRPHQTTVILDIACCDGPVQFKRISNPNFALTVEHNEVCPPTLPVDNVKTPLSKPSGTEGQPHNEKYGGELTERSSFSANATCAGEASSSRFQPPHQAKTVEDGGRDLNAANEESATASATVTTHKSYLCIYCNQSFKSLFCYQKHKKRHLNPVSVDITTTTANSTSYRASSGAGTSNNKRVNIGGGVSTGGCGGGGGGGGGRGGIIGIVPENAKAKTKDLNVQFFPCKKCGCKFPSYYFVHKHRKICH